MSNTLFVRPLFEETTGSNTFQILITPSGVRRIMLCVGILDKFDRENMSKIYLLFHSRAELSEKAGSRRRTGFPNHLC